jgi:hypothetical protein
VPLDPGEALGASKVERRGAAAGAELLRLKVAGGAVLAGAIAGCWITGCRASTCWATILTGRAGAWSGGRYTTDADRLAILDEPAGRSRTVARGTGTREAADTRSMGMPRCTMVLLCTS